MFDFSTDIIQSDTDNVLKDLASDLIFDTLHTCTPPTNVKKGDYTLLNYNGFLCYLVNNNNEPYIVLDTQYNGLGTETLSMFEDMQELMEYFKNNIIKDIKFLYNTYISNRNLYIFNTYNTESESTNISIITAEIIITLYKDLKIKPVFIKSTNLVEFNRTVISINNDVNDNIKTLYLDLKSLRIPAFNNRLYTQLNKVINVCNPAINIVTINSHGTCPKISDINEYLDYLKASKFKGNIKGTGAINKVILFRKIFDGKLYSEEIFRLYSYNEIIFSITNYYLEHFQIYKITYEKDTINKYTSSYDIMGIISTYYNLSYNQVKEDIMIAYNLLCDKYYKGKVEYFIED